MTTARERIIEMAKQSGQDDEAAPRLADEILNQHRRELEVPDDGYYRDVDGDIWQVKDEAAIIVQGDFDDLGILKRWSDVQANHGPLVRMKPPAWEVEE